MAEQWSTVDADRKAASYSSVVPVTIEPLKPGEMFTLPDGQIIPISDGTEAAGTSSSEPNNNVNSDEVQPLVIIPDDDGINDAASESQQDSKANVWKTIPKVEVKAPPSARKSREPTPVVYEVLDSDEESDTPTSGAVSSAPKVKQSADLKPAERNTPAGKAEKPVTPQAPEKSKSTASTTVKNSTPNKSSKSTKQTSLTCPVPACNKKLFSSKMEAFVHWNINHDFNAICFTCRDCQSVKSWPREPFIGHINQAHKRCYTAVLDQIDKKFINPKDIDAPNGYENWCNEKIYPKRNGHINVVWKAQGIKCPVSKCTSKDHQFTDPVEFFEHWKLVHRVETDHFVCKHCAKGMVFQTKYKQTLIKHIEKAHLEEELKGNIKDHLVIEISRNLEYIDPYPYTIKKNDKIGPSSKDSPKKDTGKESDNSPATEEVTKTPPVRAKADSDEDNSLRAKSSGSNTDKDYHSSTKPSVPNTDITTRAKSSASNMDKDYHSSAKPSVPNTDITTRARASALNTDNAAKAKWSVNNSDSTAKSPSNFTERPRITYRTIRKGPASSASPAPPAPPAPPAVSDSPLTTPKKEVADCRVDNPSVVPSRACTPSDIFLNTQTHQYIQWTSAGVSCPIDKCKNLQLHFRRDVIKHWQEFHTGSGVIYECPACTSTRQFTSNRLGHIFSHIREEHVNDIPEKLRDREINRILGTVKLKENQNVEFIDPSPFQLLLTEENLKDPLVHDTLQCPASDCEIEVTSYEMLTSHWKAKHVPTVVAYPCPMCGRPFKCSSSLRIHLESECSIRAMYDAAEIPSVVENIKECILQNENFEDPGKFYCVGEVLQAVHKAIGETKAEEAVRQDLTGVRFHWSLRNQQKGYLGIDILGQMWGTSDQKKTFGFEKNMECPVRSCSTPLKDFSDLREHWVQRHAPFSLHYDCPVGNKCREKFKGASGLEAHLKYTHNCAWNASSLKEFISKSQISFFANDSYIEPDVVPLASSAPVPAADDENGAASDDADDYNDDFNDCYDDGDDDYDDGNNKDDDSQQQESNDGDGFVSDKSRSHVLEWIESGVKCPVAACGHFLNTKQKAILHWLEFHNPVLKYMLCPLCEKNQPFKSLDNNALLQHIKGAHGRTFELSISQVEDLVRTAVVEEEPNSGYKDPKPWTFPESNSAVRNKLRAVLTSLRSAKERRSDDDSGSPPAKRACTTPNVKQEPADPEWANIKGTTPSPASKNTAAIKVPANFKMATLEEVRFEQGHCPVRDCKCSRKFACFKDFEVHWELVHIKECEQYLCPLCPPDNPTQFREKLMQKDFQVHLRCKKHFGKPVTKSTFLSLMRKMKRIMLPNKNYVPPLVPKSCLLDPSLPSPPSRRSLRSASIPNGVASDTVTNASVNSGGVSSPRSVTPSRTTGSGAPIDATSVRTNAVKLEPAGLPSSYSPAKLVPSPRVSTRSSQDSRDDKSSNANSPSSKVSSVTPKVTAQVNRTARKRTAPVAAAATVAAAAASSVAKASPASGDVKVKHTARKSTAKPNQSVVNPSSSVQAGNENKVLRSVAKSTASATSTPTGSPEGKVVRNSLVPLQPKAVKVGQAVLKAPVDFEPIPAGCRLLTDEEGSELPVGKCPIKDCKETVPENFKRHWEIFHKPSSLYICCPLCPAHSRFSIRSTVDINSLSRHITGTHETADSPPTLVRDTLTKVLRVMMKNPKYIRPLVLEKDFPLRPVEKPQTKVEPSDSPPKPTPPKPIPTPKSAGKAPSASSTSAKKAEKPEKVEKPGKLEKPKQIEGPPAAKSTEIAEETEEKPQPVSKHYPNLIGYESIIERNGKKYYLVRKDDVTYVEGVECPILGCHKILGRKQGLHLHWVFKHQKTKTTYYCPLCPNGEFCMLTKKSDKFRSHLTNKHSASKDTVKNIMKQKLKGKKTTQNIVYLEPIVPVDPLDVTETSETKAGQKKRKLEEVEKKITGKRGRPAKRAKLEEQKADSKNKKESATVDDEADEMEKEVESKGGKKPEKGKKIAKELDGKQEKETGKMVVKEKDGKKEKEEGKTSKGKGSQSGVGKEAEKKKFSEMVFLHKMTKEEILVAQDKIKQKVDVQLIDAIPDVPREVLEFDPLKNMPRSEAGLRAYMAWLKKMHGAVSAAEKRLKCWRRNAEKQEQKMQLTSPDNSLQSSPSAQSSLFLVSGDTPICEIKFDSPKTKISPNAFHVACSQTQETIHIEKLNSDQLASSAANVISNGSASKESVLPKFDCSMDPASMPRLSFEGGSKMCENDATSMPRLSVEGVSVNNKDDAGDKSTSTAGSAAISRLSEPGTTHSEADLSDKCAKEVEKSGETDKNANLDSVANSLSDMETQQAKTSDSAEKVPSDSKMADTQSSQSVSSTSQAEPCGISSQEDAEAMETDPVHEAAVESTGDAGAAAKSLSDVEPEPMESCNSVETALLESSTTAEESPRQTANVSPPNENKEHSQSNDVEMDQGQMQEKDKPEQLGPSGAESVQMSSEYSNLMDEVVTGQIDDASKTADPESAKIASSEDDSNSGFTYICENSTKETPVAKTPEEEEELLEMDKSNLSDTLSLGKSSGTASLSGDSEILADESSEKGTPDASQGLSSAPMEVSSSVQRNSDVLTDADKSKPETDTDVGCISADYLAETNGEKVNSTEALSSQPETLSSQPVNKQASNHSDTGNCDSMLSDTSSPNKCPSQ